MSEIGAPDQAWSVEPSPKRTRSRSAAEKLFVSRDPVGLNREAVFIPLLVAHPKVPYVAREDAVLRVHASSLLNDVAHAVGKRWSIPMHNILLLTVAGEALDNWDVALGEMKYFGREIVVNPSGGCICDPYAPSCGWASCRDCRRLAHLPRATIW